MFNVLASIAALSFLAHVVLLVASLYAGRFDRSKYFWSHATLWLTGGIVFLLALLYSGSGKSGFIDYFDTGFKKMMILAGTVLLSFVAHKVVSRLIVKGRGKAA
ncbi:MAG: hypothetical protein JST68_04485 [Bacteroidetes bacterium]|nr:hypothetical protein [Bacteroidota bacterium]